MESKNHCIFCDISNNLETYKNQAFFLESELAFAIPDKYPKTLGHSLVISKKHYPNLMETEDNVLEDVIKLAKKTAQKLLTIHNNIKGFNYISNQNKEANQIIFHLHLHIIPKY